MRVVVLNRLGDRVTVTEADNAHPARTHETEVDADNLAAAVARIEHDAETPPRWVWDSTAAWYPQLVAAGVRVERCHDLRLARRILRGSELATPVRTESGLAEEAAWDDWDGGWAAGPESTAARLAEARPETDVLFDPDTFREPERPGDPVADGRGAAEGSSARSALAEWERQQSLLATLAATHPGSAHRLRLLLAAESSGALAAVELHHDGLPFDRRAHEATLERLLGPRPGQTGPLRAEARPARPAHLEALAQEIRDLLGAPALNPDSPPHLLRELRRNGLDVTSTSRWELARADHPVVEPLTEYKRLSRLLSANGWAWLDAWVEGERFRPDYVPAGVVTGRWSSRGGGALSLPHVIRDAVRAQEGWRLVVADAAQLEPRILAAVSGDEAMLAAGEGRDLYAALVDGGVVDTRAHAKVGMLAVLYGGTSGNAGVILPRLARAYPRAMALVDDAAHTGEAGGVVTTWLGRTSPPPGAEWRATQAAASGVGASAAEESRARSRARDWGRFTRNFVVQGSAAEWVLAWQAGVRQHLRALTAAHELPQDAAPHLAFFLHDELVIHTPEALADDVVAGVEAAARAASTLLFPHLDRPGLIPLDTTVVESYADADEVSSSAIKPTTTKPPTTTQPKTTARAQAGA